MTDTNRPTGNFTREFGENVMTAEEVAQYFTGEFGERVRNIRVEHHPVGVKKMTADHVWFRISRDDLLDVVKHLMKIEFPHLAVASGSDLGDEIEVIYHFGLFSQSGYGEINVNIGVRIPKSDPWIHTLTGLIPGALTTEREKQEMLGITVKNIPDPRHVFLARDFPEGHHPWRKDDMGVEDLIYYVHDTEAEERARMSDTGESDPEKEKTGGPGPGTAGNDDENDNDEGVN